MANWDHPTLNSNYTSLLSELKNRDLDVATMFKVAPASPVDGMVRLQRNPIQFQERIGTDWEPLILSPAGGGTGVNTLVAFKDSLSFGTMSSQNSDAVAITGGKITGVSGIGVANESIDTLQLADGAVTDVKLATSGLNLARFTVGNLNGSRIGDIPASKIATGTLDSNRLPGLAASKVTFGRFNALRLGFGDGATKFLRRDSIWATIKLSDLFDAGSIASKDIWEGSQSAYNSLGAYEDNRIYFITS